MIDTHGPTIVDMCMIDTHGPTIVDMCMTSHGS